MIYHEQGKREDGKEERSLPVQLTPKKGQSDIGMDLLYFRDQ